LVVLNFTVTSNHIHLLVFDDKGRDVISQSIKLVVGRTSQEYNMVRASVVSHPSEWKFGGYNEIQQPRRKCAIIAFGKLAELSGFSNYAFFRNIIANTLRNH
jgi:putative transposase